jgi:hypothetical protein
MVKGSTTELCCEPRVLESPQGRRRILRDLRALCRAIEIDGPPTYEDGWFLIPAEPLAVFRGLQRVDPHWSRLFALVPTDGALRRRALRVSGRTVPGPG